MPTPKKKTNIGAVKRGADFATLPTISKKNRNMRSEVGSSKEFNAGYISGKKDIAAAKRGDKSSSSTTNNKNTKKGSSYSRSDKAYKDVSKQKAKKELEKAKLNYTETKYDTKHVPTQKKYRAALTKEQAKGISKTVAQRKKRVQAVQSYGESVRNRGRAISAFTKQYPAKKRRPGQFD